MMHQRIVPSDAEFWTRARKGKFTDAPPSRVRRARRRTRVWYPAFIRCVAVVGIPHAPRPDYESLLLFRREPPKLDRRHLGQAELLSRAGTCSAAAGTAAGGERMG